MFGRYINLGVYCPVKRAFNVSTQEFPNETGEKIPRAYGTEIEYGLVYNGAPQIPPDLFECLPYGLTAGGRYDLRKNGSRIYKDLGDHPEYATPECATLDDIVAAEFAGEAIMIGALANIAQKRSGDSFRLHKRGVGSNGRHFGAHVSYNVDRSIGFDVDTSKHYYLVQALASYNVSRLVLFGAGRYDANEKRWYVSQRADCLKELMSGTCHARDTRPIVDTRNEPWADKNKFRRLHDSSGDPNISPWALRSKIGMTSAYLRLLENNIDVSDLFIRNPVASATAIATDTKLKHKIELLSGRKMTALEMLAAMGEKILKLEEKTASVPDDELGVVEEIVKLGKSARENPDELNYKADWQTRRMLAEAKVPSVDKKRQAKLGTMDFYYDLLAKKEQASTEIIHGAGVKLREKGMLGDYDADNVAWLQVLPPASSRAYLRGLLIAAAADKEVISRYGALEISTWDSVKFAMLPKKFDLSNPLRTESNRTMRRIFKVAGIALNGC